MLGGGRDRADLTPYDPEAFLESDDPNDLMGCHTGSFMGLNVSNPQPGFFYAWADDSRAGMMRARIKGYHVVGAEDPEMAGYRRMSGHDHQDLDSANTGFPGVVLVRRSAKDERRIKEEEQVKRDDLLRSGATEEAFLDGASAQERQLSGERFVRPDHRSYSTTGVGENSQVIDAWTPSRGISS
jgi:hypothetical protein